MWRSIREARVVLSLGLIKRIGSGSESNIWHDNWLPRDYKRRPICARSTNQPTLVSDLIDHASKTWSRQVLEEHFIAPDIDIILNIPLSSRIQSNFWAWHYDNKQGIFSVCSAYRMISGIKAQQKDWLEHQPSNSNQAATKKGWSNLSKVKVLSKVCVFVWCLAHTSLPTGMTRYERNMATSQICSIFSTAEDTWSHSLFECRMARCVWALGDEEILEHAISNQAEDARLWLFWLLDLMAQHDLARVLITMWSIWWERRRAIHDNEFKTPLSTMSFITHYLRDLGIVVVRAARTTGALAPRQRSPRWHAPEGHAVKMNMDGGFSRHGDKEQSRPSAGIKMEGF